MQKTLAKRQVTEYTEFLKSINVIFLALIECEAQIDRAQFFKTEEGLGVAAHAGLLKVGKDAFEVRAEITVRAFPKNKKEGSLKIKAVFLVHLHAKTPINKRHVERFVESDLRIVIWPYFREFISSISGRMHIPPITLPIAGAEKE